MKGRDFLLAICLSLLVVLLAVSLAYRVMVGLIPTGICGRILC